jgi:Fe-S cluster biogenesis protein NfuA
MEIEKSVKQWVLLDNKIKELNDEVKSYREQKKQYEEGILEFINENATNDQTPVIKISDGRLKYVETKQTQPLTLKFIEQCLTEKISNANTVEQLMNYIKSKRESKSVPELKRYYAKGE